MTKKSVIAVLLFFIMLVSSVVVASSRIFVKAEEVLGLKGNSYVLVEADSLQILASKNETEKLPVASICKLMTTLITMEYIDSGNISLSDEVTISEHASSMEGSQAFLDAGSKYTVEELLKTVIIASANDSSVALAEYIAGSENNFVALMNKRASELGMNDTIYENATGLNTMGQHSTALDTAKVLREVNKHDIYHKYCKVWMDKLVHPSGRETELVNTNRLVRYYDKCISGKTGFTDEAGYCLSSIADNGNMKLIAVTLQCQNANDRFEDSVKLFNWGFANYKANKIVDSTITQEVDIKLGGKEKLVVAPERDFVKVTKIQDNGGVDISYEYKKISAPIKENDVCGKITIVDSNGVVLDEINIIAKESVDKAKLSQIFGDIVEDWQIL